MIRNLREGGASRAEGDVSSTLMVARFGLALSLTFVAALVGCGDEGPRVFHVTLGPVDGGPLPTPPDAATVAALSIEAPAAPSAPSAIDPGECPAGFVASTLAGADVCDPFPAGPDACAEGDLSLPGEGCVSPPECSSEFPAAAANTLYVRAGASAGDGSRDHPFGDYGSAFSAAVAGDTILVAPGVYEGPNLVKGGVTVRGLCRDTVVFRASSNPIGPDPDATLYGYLELFALVLGDYGAIDGDIVLENVTVSAPDRVGILLLNGQGILRNVRIDGAEGFGVYSTLEPDETGPETGTYRLESVSIENVAAFTSERLGDVFFTLDESTVGKAGNGVYANYTDLIVEGSQLLGTHGSAIYAGAESAISVSRVAVRGVRAGELDVPSGDCFSAIGARSFRVVESYCEDFSGRGLSVSGTAAEVERLWLVDGGIEVRDPADLSMLLGQGLQAFYGGSISGRWVTASNLRGLAISATDPATGGGPAFDLMDVVVSGVRESYFSAPLMAVGVWTVGGAAGRVERMVLENVGGTGAYAQNAGAELELTDVSLRRVSTSSLGRAGYGVVAGAGASVALTRAEVDTTERISVLASGGTLALSDVHASDDGSFGLDKAGLYVTAGGAVEGTRVALETAGGYGVVFHDETAPSTLRDLRLSPAPGASARGEALAITHAADVTLHRVALESVVAVGLLVETPAIVEASDLRITGERCAGACEYATAYAISSLGDPALTLENVHASSSGCGLHVGASEDGTAPAGGAQLSIAHGRLVENSVGVCAEAGAEFVRDFLADDVLVYDNIIPLAAQRLPVPAVPDIEVSTDSIDGWSEGGQQDANDTP